MFENSYKAYFILLHVVENIQNSISRNRNIQNLK